MIGIADGDRISIIFLMFGLLLLYGADLRSVKNNPHFNHLSDVWVIAA